MKKLGKILLFGSLFSTLLCGCQKENVEGGEFVATMEGSDGKSYIANKHNCWEATDRIYVNGQSAKEFRLDATKGKAIFKPAERAASYKMFTYGGQSFTWSGNTITFSLPQSYSGQDMPMYATTEDFGPVEFRNLFSVMHFYNIPTTGTNTIKVEAYKRGMYNRDVTNHISGDFTVNFSSSTPTVTGGTGSGNGKTRTFTPAAGATEAWMVIPANASQEYTITITNWNDAYSSTKTTQIQAGKLINVDYNEISDCVLVSTAAELNAQLNSGESMYIRLTNDIDFSGYGAIYQQFGGGGYFESIKIDGQGHTLTLNKPIYSQLRSTIKIYNLNLTGNFSTNYAGAFAAVYAQNLGGLLKGKVTATNCSSTVTYNGSTVPFTAPQ